MFKNYFKTGLRNLWKDKTSTCLNLAGMAIGMTCCMLILIYILDEISFNKFNTNLDNIYQVKWTSKDYSQTNIFAFTPAILETFIQAEVPQVKAAARLYQRSGEMEFQNAGNSSPLKRFQEQNIYFSDKSLFKIFTIPFLRGDINTALSAPNSVVINDEVAKKYFGTENPVGKVLLYEDKTPLQVAGVVKKMPANSDLQFDFLISFETIYSVETPQIANFIKTDWVFNPVYTFCLLNSPGQQKTVERSLNGILTRHGDNRSRNLNTASLLPLRDVHLHASSVIGNFSTSNIIYIYIFAIIGFLILLIASVNYINLSTARSVNRTREVGMRKVLGATKKQLVLQFLAESVLLTFLSLLFSLLLTYFGLHILNNVTGKHLQPGVYLNIPMLILFASVFLCSGVSGGLYPAFFISRFNTISSMKGKAGETSKKYTLRRVLLVSQFAICIILIIGAMVVYQQLQYLRNKPLGFQKEQMVVVPLFGTGASSIDYSVTAQLRQQMNIFTNELKKFNRIKDVTAASAMPGQGYVSGLVIPEGFKDKDNVFVAWASVDYNFTSALHIPVVAGRSFDKAKGFDHLTSFILNESAVRSFGWKSPQAAIGKKITRGNEINGKKGYVIGVIKDFIFNPLDQPMQPLIMDVNAPRFTQIAVNIQSDHMPETISYIHQKWDEIFPERIFEYSFLDKSINDQYKDKESLSKIIEYFALIAIFLSCLGLFSLASFLAMQRTREIGIRKVLGANIKTILILLSRDFVLLVAVGFVISSPIAWYVMHQWLLNFAYRINISWWIFPVAGVSVVILTIITVSFQSIKVILIKPVKSLRSE